MAEAIRSNEKSNLTDTNLLDQLSYLKREAYSCLDQALNLDANNQRNESIILYRKCIQLLKKSIDFIQNQYDAFKQQPEVTKLKSELTSMLDKTKNRLDILEDSINKKQIEKSQINDDFVITDGNRDYNDEFIDIGDEILSENDTNIDNNPSTIELNATEIFTIDSNVQFFYISNDGSVSTPSYPSGLSIYSFNDPNSPTKAFIKIGHWIYPLDPEKVSIMKTVYGAYLLPSISDKIDGIKCDNIGIMFTDNVNDETKCFFEDILSNFSRIIIQQGTSTIENQNKRSTINDENIQHDLNIDRIVNENSEKNHLKEKIIDEKENEKEKTDDKEALNKTEQISRTLITGAQYLTKGVNITTEYANKYIQIGSDKIKIQLKQNETASNIDPRVHKCIDGVRYGTNITVRVSSYAVNKLSELATSVAKTVAPHLITGSTKFLTNTGIVKSQNHANDILKSVCTVGNSTVTGFGIVTDSLEQASKSLAQNLAQETVHIVQYKYGDDASQVTDKTLRSVGNAALTIYNIKGLKITKTFAKETTKEALRSFSKDTNNDNSKNSTPPINEKPSPKEARKTQLQ